MKIPRLSGNACCTLHSLATRLSLGEIGIGILCTSLFFYVSTTLNKEEETYQTSNTILIVLGVIFIFPALFGMILFVALWRNKKSKLFLVYCFYGLTLSILLLILFIGLGIFSFISITVGTGFGCLAIGILISGGTLYNTLIVYSVYKNLEEQEAVNHLE